MLTVKHPKWFKGYCSMQACLSSPASSSSSSSSLCQAWAAAALCLQLLVPRAEEEEEEEEEEAHKLWPADYVECCCLFSVHIVLILSDLFACNLEEVCSTLSAWQLRCRHGGSCVELQTYPLIPISFSSPFHLPWHDWGGVWVQGMLRCVEAGVWCCHSSPLWSTMSMPSTGTSTRWCFVLMSVYSMLSTGTSTRWPFA